MATTRSGKLRFTDEQYKIARYDSSALAYAQAQGYNLKKEGRHWHMVEHDSMVFTQDGRWYWNSRGVQGGALEFIMHYEQKALPEAVLVLCGEQEQERYTKARPSYPASSPAPKAEFEVPKRSSDYKRLFGCLVNGRGLDYDIVSELVQAGIIYPTAYQVGSATLVNACFVGKDEKGVVKSAFMRGCSDKSTFKMEAPGSDKTTVFSMPGDAKATDLCVFEGAIDAISHASLCMQSGQQWKDVHRISQGGNAPIEAITNYLNRYPGIERIWLCMDNDNAGNTIEAKITQDLQSAGYTQKIESDHCPQGKDWNEFLQMTKAQSREEPLENEDELER